MDNLPDIANAAGLWVGFFLSLLIFSRIFGDHLLARLAQYLLVGASLGYLVVLIVQNVLRPRLIQPLLDEPTADLWLYVPLVLGVILCIAGLDCMAQQARQDQHRLSFWRRGLTTLGMIPVALVVGIAIATAVVGTIQGTLLPQFLQAAESGIQRGGTNGQLFTGVFTLLITTGALLHLYVDSSAGGSEYLEADQESIEIGLGGRLVRGLLWLWTWVGKRALWLAAGMIFARLIASRLSLLIARFEYFYQVIEKTGLW